MVLAIAFVAALFWAKQENTAHAQVSQQMENYYQSAFYELLESMENLTVLIDKVSAASSSITQVKLLSDIRWQASFAQDKLSALPFDYQVLTESEKFLNQVGDYAASLAHSLTSGNSLTEEQGSRMKQLGEQVTAVCSDLQSLQQRMVAEDLRFFDPKKKKNAAAAITADSDPVGFQFQQINDRATDYPTLIYDGPFSDHMEEQEPLGLTGAEITFSEAQTKAQELKNIQKEGATYHFEKTTEQETAANATIPVFRITAANAGNRADFQENIELNFTRTGGHLIFLMNDRHLGQATISEEEGIAAAETFLLDAGFPNMSPTYITNQDNALTIAYVYTEKGVLVYPDQVKVKVALDNGQIVGFEAASYFMSHHTRNWETPALDASTAGNPLLPYLHQTKGV